MTGSDTRCSWPGQRRSRPFGSHNARALTRTPIGVSCPSEEPRMTRRLRGRGTFDGTPPPPSRTAFSTCGAHGSLARRTFSRGRPTRRHADVTRAPPPPRQKFPPTAAATRRLARRTRRRLYTVTPFRLASHVNPQNGTLDVRRRAELRRGFRRHRRGHQR